MKLYNSMTRKKEDFKPIHEGEVLMYSCGPTVYNFFHLGNARPFIIFDTLRRYLEFKGYDVKFVQNFTDIDDKMIKNANEQGITVADLAEKFIGEYFIDAKGLGIKEASVHPRATENIDAIIELISTLIEKGYAYESDGDVYFRTLKFAEYGKLSHQPLEDLQLGARIGVGEKKEDPMDFALWKAKKPGEPAWKCPWGEGRPGWHIECSAMANKYLGKTIDIHSGGKDLIFPHHENEIAQSEAANGQTFANYWLHNGFINVNNEKMSKSLGNFFTIRDIAAKYDYEVIRYFMLSAHYRSPINFSDELMEQAKTSLERLYTCIELLDFLISTANGNELLANEQTILDKVTPFREKFIAAMDDDINTADAISVLHEIVTEINTDINAEKTYTKALLEKLKAFLKELGGVLGLLQKTADESIPAEVLALVDARTAARKDKNWAEADRIRDELTGLGYEVKDTPKGAQIKKIK